MLLPSIAVLCLITLVVAGWAGPSLLGVSRKRERRRRHNWPLFTLPAGLQLFARLTPAAIREKIGELADRAQAIADLAEAEKRDLTAEEKAEIDAILGVGKKGDAGYKAGQIDALDRDLERVEKLEARQAELAQARNRVPPQRQDGPAVGGDDEAPRVSRVRIPVAAQYRYGRLKAYTGPDAERTAYLAGQFFLASLFNNKRAQQWCQQFGIDARIQAALSEGTDSAGGVLVPVEVEQTIIDLRENYGTFRRRAKVVPMARDTKTQPVRQSGITATWVGENDEISASDKAWKQLNLVARKLAALTRYSTELGEDATISIGDDLTREFASAFALAEDQAGFLGDGSATYGGQVGLKNAVQAGSIYTALAGNITFGTLDLEDFEGAIGALPDYPGMDARWYISKPGYWNSMVRLMAAQGGTTWEKTAEGQLTPIFLGYPVEICQVLHKTLTSSVSTIHAYIGDLSMAAMLGNRRGMSIQISDQRYFEYDQIGIKGTQRATVAIVQPGDASNAGPIIALKTPGA